MIKLNCCPLCLGMESYFGPVQYDYDEEVANCELSDEDDE